MTGPQRKTAEVPLEQLIALNDEIAALARAGVPLEEGLLALGGDMPGGLGRLTQRIGERLSAGEPLTAVLDDPALGIPPVYRAVVAAGLRGGRLAAALESLAGSLRRLVQMRQDIAAAMLYPAIVLMAACWMFGVFCMALAPRLASGVAAADLPGDRFFGFLAAIGAWAPHWCAAISAAIVLGLFLAWRRSLRGTMAQPAGWRDVFEWTPWIGGMRRCLRAATYAEVLTALVENRVPLTDACTLAAEAAGDRRLTALSARLAEALCRGQSAAEVLTQDAACPPRLRLIFATASGPAHLAASLRAAAESFRRQAAVRAELVRIFLPVVLLISVGGTATFAYTLILFFPYIQILRALS